MTPRNRQPCASDEEESPSFYYLPPSAARALPNFQYEGEDRSLLFKYILSPFASFCVACIPTYVAPNTITLFGLSCMVASYVFMWYHVPTVLLDSSNEDPPRWIFIWNALSILIYQTTDNMDGKQARRTNSSSPLGLLFDHGVDAVNSLFGSVNWMVAMQLTTNDLWLSWAILFGPYALFFISTWEEYYTGKLIMPIVNGPSEGLLGGALMSLTSFVYGPPFWQQYHWYEWMSISSLPRLRNADILVLLSTIGVVQETCLKMIFVVQTFGIAELWNLLPFVTLLVCSLVIGLTDVQIWLDMPRTSLHLFAILFVEMTTDLMLAHITKQSYQPCRWPLFPLIVLTIAVCTGYCQAGRPMQDFLLLYTSAIGAYVLLKATIVIHECCTLLNIWCFDITTPRKRPILTNGKSHTS